MKIFLIKLVEHCCSMHFKLNKRCILKNISLFCNLAAFTFATDFRVAFALGFLTFVIWRFCLLLICLVIVAKNSRKFFEIFVFFLHWSKLFVQDKFSHIWTISKAFLQELFSISRNLIETSMRRKKLRNKRKTLQWRLQARRGVPEQQQPGGRDQAERHWPGGEAAHNFSRKNYLIQTWNI